MPLAGHGAATNSESERDVHPLLDQTDGEQPGVASNFQRRPAKLLGPGQVEGVV